MSRSIVPALCFLVGAAGCTPEAEVPNYDRFVDAMKREATAEEVLPTLGSEPTLVASATAESGQWLELYEFQPDPGREAYITLTFGNDTLLSVGAENPSPLSRWWDRAWGRERYSPGYAEACEEALERSWYTRSGFSMSTC